MMNGGTLAPDWSLPLEGKVSPPIKAVTDEVETFLPHPVY